MLRKRNDSVKSGKGIDGAEGENYTDGSLNRTGRNYPGGTKGGSEGGCGKPADERSYAGEYTSNDAGLVDGEDFQWQAGVRDIMADVMANDRPGGDDNTDFDTTGPVTAGVNRSQSEGNHDLYRAKKP